MLALVYVIIVGLISIFMSCYAHALELYKTASKNSNKIKPAAGVRSVHGEQDQKDTT